MDEQPGSRDDLVDEFVGLATKNDIPIAMFHETEVTDISKALGSLGAAAVAAIKNLPGIGQMLKSKTEIVVRILLSYCVLPRYLPEHTYYFYLHKRPETPR